MTPARLDSGLAYVDAVINASLDVGLVVTPVEAGRGNRAGIGLGQGGFATPVRIEEGRDLIELGERDLDQWLLENPGSYEWEHSLRQRRSYAKANGSLQVRLPERHDPPPSPEAGWRSRFKGEPTRPLSDAVAQLVEALQQRAAQPFRPRPVA